MPTNASSKPITISAPGNMMLLGEHAVLHGSWSIACAVNKRMRLTLTPGAQRTITIASALGTDTCNLDAIEVRDPFRFLWATLRLAMPLPGGCTLTIESEFSDQIGFGSSAAVTVCLLAALAVWKGNATLERHELHRDALTVIREVQRRGSGADAAASLFGGLVAYRSDPVAIKPLRNLHPITVAYCGYKRPTAEVIAQVDEARAQQPEIYDGVFRLIDQCARQGRDAIERADWLVLGRIMNMHQGLLDAIGVNDAALTERILALRAQPDILGAKISGSGLGDCVIGLGTATSDYPFATIPVAIEPEGVRLEKS